LALRLRSSKTRQDARRVFWASLVYLPLLLTVLLAAPNTSPKHQRGGANELPSLALRANPSYAVARVGVLVAKDLRSFSGQSLHYI